MKIVFLTVILLGTFSSSYGADTLCNKLENTKLALCDEILSSEIEGEAVDKITSIQLTLSTIPEKKIVCLNGEYKSIRANKTNSTARWGGVTFEDGTSPWSDSLIKVSESAENLEVKLTGAPKPPGQRGPRDYNVIKFDKKELMLEFKNNTGVHGFASLKVKCKSLSKENVK